MLNIHIKLFRILYYNLETSKTILNLTIISFIKHGCLNVFYFNAYQISGYMIMKVF